MLRRSKSFSIKPTIFNMVEGFPSTTIIAY
nr:MAG TPA: hypothetical protein [Caudoviricetes sp.]